MLSQNQPLRLLRRLRLNFVGEPLKTGGIGVLIDHPNVALCDPGDDEFIVNPDADNRVLHGQIVAPRGAVSRVA